MCDTVMLLLLVAVLGVVTAATAAVPPEYESGNPAAFLPDVFPLRNSLRTQVDLSGRWEFRRDPRSRGEGLGWADGRSRFQDRIEIPGAPQAQGLGEPNGFQRWLLNEPFWVRRSFAAPDLRPGQRAWLRLGGILPAGRVYLNGQYVGYTRSSRTPQRVDVTPFLRPGERNLIAIAVCDWPAVKLEGIWEMAELRRVWTGVYRGVALEVTDATSIVDVYVHPRLATSSAAVSLELSQVPPQGTEAVIRAKDGARVLGETRLTVTGLQAQGEVKLSAFAPWSPNHPQLYTLDISLVRGGEVTDRAALRFGMREIETRDRRFYLNGHPVYLRAFGDDQLYPHTLAPPPDKEWYLERLRRARAFGLNAAKSCEEIFTPEYLEAADEAGILIIQEMPFGLSGEVRINQHQLAEPWRTFYGRELEGLVRFSRNHASVVAFSFCSEVPLDGGTQEAFDFFCRQCPTRTRELAPHALVTDNTGYHGNVQTPRGERITDFYAIVISTWCKEALEEPAVVTDNRHPTILHEYNWWSCYPDPVSRARYDDTAIVPWWLEVLEQTAKAGGVTDLIPTYRRNSLWLQALCRKDGLEYARRCPNVEGYILWLLIDFGQYTEGVFDDFWEPKNVSAPEFLQSTADTVVLLGQEGNRCLKMGGTHRIPLAISHYGEDDLSGCVLRWEVAGAPAGGRGEIAIPELRPGEVTQAGAAAVTLPEAASGYSLELRVTLVHEGQEVNTNQWSFWALPEAPAALPSVAGVCVRVGAEGTKAIPAGTELVLADRVDATLADYVEAGGRCLLFSSGSGIAEPETYYKGYTTFRTIPWNGAPGNSGTVISPHPALAAFPHGEACDFQLAWLIKQVHPLNIGGLRQYGVEPIIRDIDFYQTNKNLAYLMEFGVGRGKVLVTSLGILPKLEERLEARELLRRLVEYARGPEFAPTAEVPREEFARLLGPKAE